MGAEGGGGGLDPWLAAWLMSRNTTDTACELLLTGRSGEVKARKPEVGRRAGNPAWSLSRRRWLAFELSLRRAAALCDLIVALSSSN